VRALRVCVLVVLAAGCGRNKVTHGNIDHWITIEGGENKLKGAISGGYSAELRGHAVAALVQADLDGVNLADEALGKLPDSDQQAAMGEAVKRLMELGGGTQVGQTPQGKQIIAKDALFQLRKHASPADRDKIDVFLAAWVVADPPKRWETGRNTGDKILAELGPAASSELKRALAAGTPALKEVSAALGKIGTPQDRDDAVQAILEGLKAKGGAPSDDMLLAVGSLGGPKAMDWLLPLIKDPDPEMRFKAMQVIGKNPDHKELLRALDAAIAAAANDKEDGRVRDEGLGVLQAIGGKEALDALVKSKLFDDPKEVVRFEAYEVALRGAKELAIVPVFEALPEKKDYPPGLLEKYVGQYVRPIGPKAVEPLRKELGSKNWVARLAAIQLLGDLGDKQDLPALEALAKDQTKLRGWPGQATIGSEAQAAAEKLKKKS
jgi:hypothetical protein